MDEGEKEVRDERIDRKAPALGHGKEDMEANLV